MSICTAPLPEIEGALVVGHGASAVDVVRGAENDWSLMPYAPPRLRTEAEGAQARGGESWLVLIEEGHAAELDRDPAVIAYAPAWRPSPSTCGKLAVTERLVEGLLCALCAEHAAEIDAEQSENGSAGPTPSR